MTVISLRSRDLSVRVSSRGGLLLGAWWTPAGRDIPLLRACPDDATAGQSACFPMVPFGNRVRANAFRFAGRAYELEPNTADPHYLHGDGWLGDWFIEAQGPSSILLSFRHDNTRRTPYRYEAHQEISLRDGALVLGMSVTNKGDVPLPFGLGWHPYFPLTPETTLKAPARLFRSEAENWLPGKTIDVPHDLDFRQPRRIPRRWVNNGLEDWSGRAEITWPEHGAGLTLEASPELRHAFLFMSDRTFDPAFRNDYVCFEPMTHRANGHHLADLGDLRVLAPGGVLSCTLRLRPFSLGSPI